jgi:hypothetical protein
LEKTKDSVSTASNSFQISVYANDKIVCQLTDSQPIASAPANALRYHTIACVNVSDIKQEYLQIEKLLTIYRKTNKLIAFSSASRITATNGSIAYSIINLAATNYTYPRLLFAAVNDSWSYIGDLSAGDLKYSTGEYIITPEIKTKISDPKYQGFITKEIH